MSHSEILMALLDDELVLFSELLCVVIFFSISDRTVKIWEAKESLEEGLY